ncbi:MAG: hypothetical protein RLY16_1445 [Bacteroidota bacterium]|jgi:glycosyltransferase involved in cell wall biosynthesis
MKKVLIVNWSWYPTGGDWTYIENVQKLYEANGYQVIPFSTLNDRNFETPFDKYFVKSYDYKVLNKNKNFTNGLRVLKSSIVSLDALQKLDKLLNEEQISFAHLQNVHHYITPSIVEMLHKRGIKIIWTLHDFKIICPENSFISNGKICEKCIDGSFYHCATNTCKKKSFLASSLASFEAYYYHKKKTYTKVDKFLCPSNFLLNKFKEFGFKEEQLSLAHSCYDISLVDDYIKTHPMQPSKEKYVLYIGRLEQIKGVHTLIEAVIDTPIQLKIIGTGSQEPCLKDKAAGHSNIEFLGFKNKQEVFELTRNAAFVVCPSICYENLPFSVIETFLFSVPVIGAKIGGIPELVINEKTGLLFEAGNANHLCEKMRYLWNNESIATELGKNARKHAYEMVNYATHWKKIESIIQEISK